jgi:hypothetical protein
MPWELANCRGPRRSVRNSRGIGNVLGTHNLLYENDHSGLARQVHHRHQRKSLSRYGPPARRGQGGKKLVRRNGATKKTAGGGVRDSTNAKGESRLVNTQCVFHCLMSRGGCVEGALGRSARHTFEGRSGAIPRLNRGRLGGRKGRGVAVAAQKCAAQIQLANSGV